MPLTPIDVQQKTFGTALRGYDLDEVDDFLDDVVTALKDYEQRVRDAQERISALESQANDRGDAEGAIARALVAAQRSADAIVEEAKADAARIVAEAEAEATQYTEARDRERSAAEAEIERIRGLVADLRTRLAGLAGALGGTLDGAEEAIEETTSALDAPWVPPDEAVPAGARHVSHLEPAADADEDGPEDAFEPADEEDDEPDEDDVLDQDDEADDEEPAPAPWTPPASDEKDSFAWKVEDDGADDDSGHSARPWEIG